jgi:hypothetical protein
MSTLAEKIRKRKKSQTYAWSKRENNKSKHSNIRESQNIREKEES